MSKRLSFEELQKWDCAEEDFGGLINEGFGRTRALSNEYTKRNNSIHNKKEETKEETKEEINNLH
tara:strand:+ start:216 stop:410 length:195 start_codon:yes stop_codon:yes gene_type:complete